MTCEATGGEVEDWIWVEAGGSWVSARLGVGNIYIKDEAMRRMNDTNFKAL